MAGKESNKSSMEFAAIERAAKRQYVRDCANGLASSDGQCSFSNNIRNNYSHQRKDFEHRSFLPSDHDIYYYLEASLLFIFDFNKSIA